MCTVTFIPASYSSFVLTSNRDEAPGRDTLAPVIYDEQDVQLLFPKDVLAGGTWIGVSNRKRLVCLLNGGFQAHEMGGAYRMSRGVFVTSLLTAENGADMIASYNFNGIEPFTVVLVEWKDGVSLFELVWDGEVAHFSEKPLAPHIWSSSLLYTEDVKRKRMDWFSKLLMKNVRPTTSEILAFHKTAGDGNTETDLLMDRGFVKTKSISQYEMKKEGGIFRYEDLQTQEITQVAF